MRRAVRPLALSSLLLTSVTGAAGASGGHPLLRWVDDQGVVHFGDAIPPKYAGQAHDQLAPDGAVRVRVPAQPTAAQLRSQTERRAQARQDADYDQFLLQTYDSAGQILAARDERLDLLDRRIARAKLLADKSRQDYASLKAQAAGEPPTDDLLDHLNRFKGVADDNAEALQALQMQREKTVRQYQHDLKRWQALHAAAAAH